MASVDANLRSVETAGTVSTQQAPTWSGSFRSTPGDDGQCVDDLKVSMLASIIEGAEAPSLSLTGATANLSAGAVGAGLLALPSVMGTEGNPHAGVVGAILLLVVAALFQMVANRCISESVDIVTSILGKPVKSFDVVAEEAFGKCGKISSAVIINVTTMGAACAFIILLGTSLAETLNSNPTAGDKKLSIAIVGTVLTPLTFISLNDVLGLLAIGAECLILPFLVWSVVGKGPASADHCASGPCWTMTGPADQWGPAFCTIVFAIGFGFLVPTMKAQMEDSKAIITASDIAVVLCFIVYMLVMCMGYWAWGNDVEGNVLDSMDGWRVAVSRALLSVNLVISYGIMMQVSVGSLTESIGLQGRASGITLRLVLAAIACLSAVVVPYFNEFIDLTSACTVVVVNYLLPFACFWTLQARTQESLGAALGRAKGKAIVHFVVFLGGVAAMIFGLIGGFENLLDAINRGGATTTVGPSTMLLQEFAPLEREYV